MRRLPPLTALEAFVQVARLGSVKAAAEELALSTPALSRRVQALERFIGRPLFDRKHQALEINADGQRLLDEMAPALDAMSQALENIQSGGNQLRLRLAVMPLFATQRLFPHLGTLRQMYPNLHIDIETTPYAVARLGEGLDAGRRFPLCGGRRRDESHCDRRARLGGRSWETTVGLGRGQNTRRIRGNSEPPGVPQYPWALWDSGICSTGSSASRAYPRLAACAPDVSWQLSRQRSPRLLARCAGVCGAGDGVVQDNHHYRFGPVHIRVLSRRSQQR